MTDYAQIVISTVIGGVISGAMVALASVPIMKYRLSELETKIKDHEQKSDKEMQTMQTAHKEEMRLLRGDLVNLSAQLSNITTTQISELRKIYELTASSFTSLVRELMSSNATTKESVNSSLQRVHDRIDEVGHELSDKFTEVQKEFVSHKFLDQALKNHSKNP